ncbi:hypothetical protein [uncultured Sneathiella sp.]|uniref:hypothetical protein n=1 Tax=uncultured Sneathiella sp. TaxID=879315 RepID=UPI0030ECF912|tara:strand:- start:2869 stop:3789 length:921 start_codon:yes stop_codon:yes gene_type:complete
MEETHLGRSIVLNISFSDDRYALLRVSGREAEEIINLGVTVERAVSEPNSEESDIRKVAPQKSREKSPAKAIFMLILLLVTVPPVLAMFAEEHGYIPALLAGVIAIVYTICLWRPQPIPFGRARWTSAAMVCIFALGAFYVHTQLDIKEEQTALRKSDPVAYLEKLKTLGRDDRWLKELEYIDPESYKKEVARLQQEKQKVLEAERLAAMKEAEKQRKIGEREKCGDEIKAVVQAHSAVEERLKNFDSADFPWLDGGAVMLDCGRWKVTSYVDATNGFGAKIHTRFSATVRMITRERWVLEDLKTW